GLVLNTIQGVKKRESIVASLEIKSEKLKDILTSLEQELYSSNQKIAQLENALSEVHRNTEEVAQRLDIAQQEREGYHVEAHKFMTNISDRLQQEFDGTNTLQQLGIRLAQFFKMYDQMEVRYQESSLLVDQLTQSKAQLEQQVAELQEDVASKQVSNQETSSVVHLEASERRMTNELSACFLSFIVELLLEVSQKRRCTRAFSLLEWYSKRGIQRLDIAQQEREGYHVEAHKFMTVRYQESSLLVDQLTQSKAQLEQQVAELQEDVASKQVSTQSKAQLEQQVAALQKEVASQQVSNQHSGPMIKQLSDSIQNLERVNAKLSEDNSRFEEITTLIEGQLQYADALKEDLNNLQPKNEELVLNTIQGVKKRESIVASLEIKSEKLKDTLTSLEQELYSSNQKIAQLENALNEGHRNTEEVVQRLDSAAGKRRLPSKNEELVLNTIQGVKKRESIVASLEIKSEKLKDILTSLEQELYSSNQKIAQLENALSEVHRNAEEVAQRLDIAQQEGEGYHVEAHKFMTNISDRLQPEFDGTNTLQQLGIRLAQFFKMYDQMEVRYQESSLLVDQLTQSKAQLEQQVAELQEDVASKQVSNQETSSLVEQLTQSKAQLEQQVAALQKEVASQQVANQHSGPMIKQLSDSIQNLERVNAKLSEDNSEQLVEKERIVKLEPPSPTPDSSTDELQMKKELTADLKEQLDNKTEENKSLLSQLQEQGFVDQLKANLDMKHMELSKVRDELESCSNQLAEAHVRANEKLLCLQAKLEKE
ncbi:uncharacterized protein Dyak_GE28535, partial [Drosophila yakuba]